MYRTFPHSFIGPLPSQTPLHTQVLGSPWSGFSHYRLQYHLLSCSACVFETYPCFCVYQLFIPFFLLSHIPLYHSFLSVHQLRDIWVYPVQFWIMTAAAAKSLQSCPTLCGPIDGSPPGSPIPGILQARVLEWVAISFSNAWKWKVKVKSLSHVRLLATSWTAAYQAPLSMGFSRQEYWSGMPYVCIDTLYLLKVITLMCRITVVKYKPNQFMLIKL